ncbi:WD40 repeat-like protein [Pseudovirgaria hyperparasitica]|uniref:WD40 repeat-like protein n=1 Tax=Pseudovirgaria hyperparasitica TaxID=470096 RepID=A0A6A6WK41_9PEZI|nr:WD40 repeat-like protein [Pseudovirgaria hyperparasitica]KAF2762291.1 WD40 repeat-like protein [Pseudovirgaria hyperparasitica]
MTVETLSSNVVNYLVWRYLQEAGFGSAAVHLQKEWVRDPQELPFASNVKKNAMVELLQDGLYLNHLEAGVKGSHSSPRFGDDHGSQYSIHRSGGPVLRAEDDYNDIPHETNGTLHDNGSKKGPRRKKKSSGPERLNGDAMEIEPNGVHSPSRGESEALVSDVESPNVEEVQTTTLVQGRSLDVQTEKIAELAPSTIITSVDKPGSIINHVMWGHDNDTDRDVLLVAGDSLLRFYDVPTSQTLQSTAGELRNVDYPLPFNSFDVSAFAWKGPSEPGCAAFATQERITNEMSESMSDYKLSLIEGNEYRMISSLGGMIFQITWNQASQLLLTISGNDVAGLIRIWKQDFSYVSYATDQPLLDCQWLFDTRFVVCGEKFLSILELDALSSEIRVLKNFDTGRDWDRVCFDPICRFIACKSLDGDAVALAHLEDATLRIQTFDVAPVTDIAFQPIPNPASHTAESARLLAASFHHGYIQVWNVKEGFDHVYRVELEDRPVGAIAFSPDGFLLAAAGMDTVSIWQAEHGGTPKAQWHGSEEEHWAMPGSDKDAQDPLHRLAWDADSKRLAFALGNQFALINFQR